MDPDASFAFQEPHRSTLQWLDAGGVPEAVLSSRRQLFQHGKQCWLQAGGDNNVAASKHAENAIWSYARQAAASAANQQQEVACVRLVKEGGRSSVVAVGRFTINSNSNTPGFPVSPAAAAAAAAAGRPAPPALVLQCTHCGQGFTSLSAFQRHALGGKEAITPADKVALLPHYWSVSKFRKLQTKMIEDLAAAGEAAPAGGGTGAAAAQRKVPQQGCLAPKPSTTTNTPQQQRPHAAPATSPAKADGGPTCTALTPEALSALRAQYAAAVSDTAGARVTPAVSAAREQLLAAGVRELQRSGRPGAGLHCGILLKMCGDVAEAAGGGLPGGQRQMVYVGSGGEVRGAARLEAGKLTCDHCGATFQSFNAWQVHLTSRLTGHMSSRHVLLPGARWLSGAFLGELKKRWEAQQ
jgi:hypothetical protein